ncbi:MAG: glutathione S-transferase N-terminal domain-containing protein [Pseudomonadales bacterium]|nr:glutathione S-transferase N-terminal domain-containing protein [Pseudomonadales bacterium]
MAVVPRRSTMTLFSDAACQFSHRVRMVLAEKGVAVEIEEVVPGVVSEEVAELNPYGTTPTLVDRDLALHNTMVMMEYLDERFPHPPLLPVYPVARAHSRQYMHRIERDWCASAEEILRGEDFKRIDRLRQELRDSLLGVSVVFSEKPFFMSDEFTLVDCVMAPLLWRLDVLGIKLPNVRQAKPLVAYMQRLFDRPAFRASLTDTERSMRG